jgi:uncharacterized membrane protein
LYQFLKTTVVGGLIVLVPVAVHHFNSLQEVLSVLPPTAKLLHVDGVVGIAIVELAAIPVVITACFLFGRMVRMSAGPAIFRTKDVLVTNTQTSLGGGITVRIAF